jgi:hypothetical protein
MNLRLQTFKVQHAVHTNTLVRKSKDNRPLENPRHKWENNIKMDLKETG